MHLTPAEQDRLTVFTVAELARRRRDRGALLSAPEVVALVTDVIHEAAWDGLDHDAVVAAGRGAVAADEALPGVAALVRHVEVDALFPSGTSLVAVDDPLGGAYGDDQPGAVVARDAELRLSPGRDRCELDVTNTADVDVHVSSHYPFWQTNPVLSFDRDAARGYHLDVPAGSSLCLPAGATVRVRLVTLGGAATAPELGLGER